MHLGLHLAVPLRHREIYLNRLTAGLFPTIGDPANSTDRDMGFVVPLVLPARKAAHGWLTRAVEGSRDRDLTVDDVHGSMVPGSR